MITGEVGLDGIVGTFDALGDAEQQCDVLVVPNG